jgi:hypothetical protein
LDDSDGDEGDGWAAGGEEAKVEDKVCDAESDIAIFLLELSSEKEDRKIEGGKTYGTRNRKPIATQFFSFFSTCICPKNIPASPNTATSIAQLVAIVTLILISRFEQLFSLPASNMWLGVQFVFIMRIATTPHRTTITIPIWQM